MWLFVVPSIDDLTNYRVIVFVRRRNKKPCRFYSAAELSVVNTYTAELLIFGFVLALVRLFAFALFYNDGCAGNESDAR